MIRYTEYALADIITVPQILVPEMKESIIVSNKAERKKKEEALAGIFNEYYDKIARYIFVRLGNREQSEDLASDVFIKALKSLDSYQAYGVPMQAWLFRIAHNLVIDYMRKVSKRKTVPIDAVQIAGDMDPVTTAEINVEIERVFNVMEQLTRGQREVLELRFFGGLSSKEAGVILNKSDGAVREMQRTALEKLRKILVHDK